MEAYVDEEDEEEEEAEGEQDEEEGAQGSGGGDGERGASSIMEDSSEVPLLLRRFGEGLESKKRKGTKINETIEAEETNQQKNAHRKNDKEDMKEQKQN